MKKRFDWIFIGLVSGFIFVACTNTKVDDPDIVSENDNVDLSTNEEETAAAKFDYYNKRYRFAVNSPEEFDLQIFSDDTGILFEKIEPWTIVLEKKKEVPTEYKVEIGIMPVENFDDFSDITEYVAEKYQGYSFEFKEYENFSGFYVDEGVRDDAVRHFFTLSADGEIIYDAYLKVPSMYYSQYKDFFEDFVQGIVLF